ncbi:nucleotidyltransferase family protein [Planococcus sp. YIM B11945]|uniref:nucleotidyltransferase family protein n=1 Tax=Planococcus sp. YIM B11945 TaxID=3435410 RepID=UPI003D7E801E
MKTEEDVLALVEKDAWMLAVLAAARSLDLPDWWICAGFVRSKIWDALHGFNERTPLSDIDVIYFDPENLSEHAEKRVEERLHRIMPGLPWSVKNQARMHIANELEPYTSAVDAISKFPETATALGMKVDGEGTLMLTAPHGLDDALNMAIKPTPYFYKNEKIMQTYKDREKRKNWQATWKKVVYQ